MQRCCRMGGAAVLMTNKPRAWNGRAKYKLITTQRVHVGAINEAYR
jgi:hypothetical protein